MAVLAGQLAAELHERLWPLGLLTGPEIRDLALNPQWLRSSAERIARQLLDDREVADLGISGDDIAAETAQDVIIGLWPASSPPDEWWQTPLGRAVARSYGLEGSEALSASVAATMLGITRARVYQLIDHGKIDPHPDGGVVRASVMQRLNALP